MPRFSLLAAWQGPREGPIALLHIVWLISKRSAARSSLCPLPPAAAARRQLCPRTPQCHPAPAPTRCASLAATMCCASWSAPTTTWCGGAEARRGSRPLPLPRVACRPRRPPHPPRAPCPPAAQRSRLPYPTCPPCHRGCGRRMRCARTIRSARSRRFSRLRPATTLTWCCWVRGGAAGGTGGSTTATLRCTVRWLRRLWGEIACGYPVPMHACVAGGSGHASAWRQNATPAACFPAAAGGDLFHDNKPSRATIVSARSQPATGHQLPAAVAGCARWAAAAAPGACCIAAPPSRPRLQPSVLCLSPALPAGAGHGHHDAALHGRQPRALPGRLTPPPLPPLPPLPLPLLLRPLRPGRCCSCEAHHSSFAIHAVLLWACRCCRTRPPTSPRGEAAPQSARSWHVGRLARPRRRRLLYVCVNNRRRAS